MSIVWASWSGACFFNVFTSIASYLNLGTYVKVKDKNVRRQGEEEKTSTKQKDNTKFWRISE